MSQNNRKLILIIASLGILMLACNLTTAGSTPTDVPGSGATAVAQTLGAQLTEVAGIPTNTLQPPTLTSTPLPPTATQIPTSTPLPTATKTPVPTATPIPCNRAGFISDVTVSDSSLFTPGSNFSKVWRLKNTGSCAWTANYELVYYSGDKMKGDSTTKFNTRVEPGETIDVGVNLTAPNTIGKYLGYWMLRSKEGDQFGIGAGGEKPFWVEIKVVQPSAGSVFDFSEHICAAKWEDSNAPLPCQGAVGPEANVVRLSNSIKMENGVTEDELGLQINVGKSNQVSGTFPALVVQAGDHFISRIGCYYDSKDCNARFKLSYKEVGVGTEVELETWVEDYDGSTQVVDVDLSSLAGKNIKLILTVRSLTNAKVIEVFWFVPQVKNP